MDTLVMQQDMDAQAAFFLTPSYWTEAIR